MSETEAIEWTPKARAVLESASHLFYAHGIHAVGVDTIAEHAGVTKKTLYDRFGSKERLVVEYLVERDSQWRELLASRLSAVQDDPAARLAAVFDASAAWGAEHSGKGCSMINAHAEISDSSHPAYRVIVGQKRWMLDLFTQITSSAAMPDPAATAKAIMLLHEGALVTAGIPVVGDPYPDARDLALSLLSKR